MRNGFDQKQEVVRGHGVCDQKIHVKQHCQQHQATSEVH
jgi:hypothetical protein